jgi:hypothetical protein
MAYVDLNPMLACMADTPEDSDHASIKERIKPQKINQEIIEKTLTALVSHHFSYPINPLLHFDGAITQVTQSGIPFT